MSLKGRTMTRRKITEAEMAVLRVLWDQGPATTRHISDELYPSGGVSEYYTVQKLLERLEEKACVDRDRSSRAHVFRAAVEREQLMGEQLSELTESLGDGSLTPLLTSLFHVRQPTSAELEALKQLVAELEQRQRPAKRKK
jgi:BlaI family transcriptional regulator, penicillinase repressor